MANFANHPLLNLEELAETRINITEGTVNIFNPTRLQFDVEKNLTDNEFCEEDAIVCSGNAIINFIVGGTISKLGIKKHKFIIHNAKKKQYELLKEDN